VPNLNHSPIPQLPAVDLQDPDPWSSPPPKPPAHLRPPQAVQQLDGYSPEKRAPLVALAKYIGYRQN